MTQQEICKAFENRWRFKSTDFMELDATLFQRVKELCRDFFEAGIIIAERSVCCCTTATPTTHQHEPSPKQSLFEQWWNLYDKKIDRGKCEKKWEKLTVEEKMACLAATPAYVASTPDLQYRRHPATYLNNKSWENQIITHDNATDKPTIEQQRIAKLADILAG